MYLEIVFPVPIDKSFLYNKPEEIEHSIKGCRVSAPFGRRDVKGMVISETSKRPKGNFEIKNIKALIDREPIIADEQIELARWVSSYYYCSLGEAVFSVTPAGAPAKKPRKEPDVAEPEISGLQLSGEQENALNEIINAVDEEAGKGFLLYGVTGSGKTEVYIRAVKHALSKGKQAIICIPEISLTPQTIERFEKRFSESIAVIHSRLTPTQKYRYWTKILKGEVRLVIGVRSAIFAPTKKTGIIILDEEHEGSYKSSDTPRYHARQAAFFRMKKEKAVLVLGSATPSIETAFHARNTQNLQELAIRKRVQNIRMPKIEMIDMKKSEKSNIFSMMSTKLVAAVNEALESKSQVMLFLNRKGYSPIVSCSHCGHTLSCPDCSVTLTYHKSRNTAICHYCGFGADIHDVCDECGIGKFEMIGSGTEKVEESVQPLFPNARIARIDMESTRRKGAYEEILGAFKDGEIDILVGTQMISKGLHFPNLTLVGILNADTVLNFPDFRSAEKTFNMITQVAGRAGRGSKSGKVYVQTYHPEHPALICAREHDYDTFYEMEIEKRAALKYPPYSRLLRLVIRGEKEENVVKDSEDIAALLKSLLAKDGHYHEVLGPTPCALEKLKKYHRWNILIKVNNHNTLKPAIDYMRRNYKLSTKNYIEIDVDPINML